MYYFFSMYDFDTSQGLVEYVEGLFDREYFVIEFALDCVKITHIAVLHDKEVPIAVYVMVSIP